MPRLYLRLSLAAIVVALLTISTGAALAAPSQQTSGICGRTAAVQTAILGEISGVTDCALVTDTHLAAITGALDLEDQSITALAAGDFDGLTALTTLWLNDNDLTTLPAVVFEDLTALTQLRLQDNPGAPFSPTADALPDDGTVPAAGGTVALDGSDGGPWGANVTYSWSQTSGPTSGVTFDDAANATPVVTIPALTAGTELIFTLTVTGRATNTSFGTAPDTDTAKVTVTASNSAPTFGDGDDTTRAVPENSSAGTNVGAAVSATDGEGDTLTYSLGGTDAGSFEIDAATGQIRTKAGVTYDFEATKNTYEVTVSVHDGKDVAGDDDDTIDAAIDVTINLTKVAVGGRPEPVANVAAVPGDSPGEIVVTWDPHPDGHEDYRVAFKPVDGRFQPVSDTAWNVFPLDNTATLTGLVPGAEYRILVRARFADGTISKWARPVSGLAAEEAPPGLAAEEAPSELAAEEAPPEFEEVWSSVLTVGALPAGVLGFQSYQGPSFAQGSLSEDRFTVDGERVWVIALFNYTGLVLGLSEELPRDFVLLSGSQEFAARDSFVQSMGTARGRYWWPTAPVGWTEGDEVQLSIAISDSGSMPQRPPAPPSGVFDDTPTSHDGVSPFEVRLLFDESNLAIDSETLKDHALAAAGADIAGVRKYSRASRNSWIATLQPTGPGAITLTLPATTDCAQPDAVCATDGRKLRARIETTIPGSTDASLSTLNTAGAVIDPAFDPAETLYTASGATQLTVTAEAAAAAHGATVSITPADTDAATAGHQVDLTAGADTAIHITVTAPDTTTTQRYWVVISDTSTPADTASALNSMQFTGLETLTFDDHQNRYELTAPADVSHTTVVTSRADTGATVEIITVRAGPRTLYADHHDADTNQPGHQVQLAETGDTLVIVRITTNDGLNQSVYLTLITRTTDIPPAPTTKTTRSSNTSTPKDTADTALPELNSLTLTGADLSPVFAPDTFEYRADAAAAVEEITIDAATDDADASVLIVPADADPNTDGWQITLGAPGSETVIAVIVSSNGQLNSYLVTVSREAVQTATTLQSLSPVDFDRSPRRDLDVVDAMDRQWHLYPYGLWSDGETMWVAVNWDAKIYAYDLASGDRRAASDIDTLDAAGNSYPGGIWSDRNTMWVLDESDDKIYAYNLASGDRRAASDIDTLVPYYNQRPMDLWSDGTTVWVADSFTSKVFAYDLASGDRRTASDIDTLDAAGNSNPGGIWSDGNTMWVLDRSDDKIYAYDLARGARQAKFDFNTLRGASNNSPSSIWSDGDTMWVLDSYDRKVYAYNMPASLPLKSLELTGVEFAFTPERRFYAVEAPATVAATTVSAVAADDSADVTVTILPADADINTAGHQIDLATGVNTVTVTVAGTATVTAYTVVVTLDAAGDSTTAGVLDLGVRVDNINRSASVRGVVDYDDDRDWFKVELQSKHRYYIDMKQTGTPDSLGDPMIMGVHDSNGDLVAGTTNDWGGDTRWRDLGEYLVEDTQEFGWPFWISPEFGPNDVGGRDAFVKFSPLQSGTYFVSVGRGAAHSSNYQNGVYDLEIVERLHEIGDTPATSQRVVVGEPAVSEIDIDPREVFFASGGGQWEWWYGDHDWWRVTLQRNRIYVIDMQGADTGHGTLRQPSLTVRPRDGNRTPINTVRIMEDVDGTSNDRQVFSPTATGDYYMLAMGGDYESISAPEMLGTYTLSVTVLPERADVPAAPTTTASVVVDASPYYGRIDHSYDRDWIGVQLQGGRSYRVTMGTDPASIAPISDDLREIPLEIGGVFAGTRVIGGRYRDVAGVFDGAGNLVRGSGEFVTHSGVPNYPDEIIIEPEADGVYYIEARGFDFHVGDYTITVEESFGPPIDIWTPGLESNPYFGYLEALGSTTIEVDTLTEGYAYTDSSSYPLDGQIPTWFSVELVAGDTYIVNVESVGGVTSGYPFNAYIRGIFDDSGRYEYFHRGDHGAATRSQLAITARSSGLYHIAVERRPSGNFTIIVNSTSTGSTTTQTPPPQDDASLSSLGVAGDDVTPEFASGVYDYSVTVAWDVSEATVDAVGTYPETVVVSSVEDLDLAPGWQVDLGPPGTETVTEIRFTSVAPDGRTWLAYTVTITRPAPDVSAGTSTDSDVEIGVGVVSKIDSAGDRDWHRVELQAGVTYQVDMEGQWTGSFSTSEPRVWISDYTLVDPVLSGVYDSLGALVTGTGDLTDSGNSGTGQNSRFTFSPTVNGTYYIEATATAAWVGTYLLTVSRITQ